MKIIVRPDPKFIKSTESCVHRYSINVIEDFFESLGLDPGNWREDQSSEIKAAKGSFQAFGFSRYPDRKSSKCQSDCQSGSFQALGMHIPSEPALVEETVWNFGVEKAKGAFRFYLNGRLIVAFLVDDPTKEVFEALPCELRHLRIETPHSLSSLGPLSGLINLMSLNLSGCKSLTDLTPLSGLANLTSLDLAESKNLADLSPLSGLLNLTSLGLRSCHRLTDMKPLSGMVKLTNLILYGCSKLTDVSPLTCLTNLTSLNLEGCNSLSDVQPLSGLTNLTSLSLGGSALTDVSPLSGLVNLTSLNLGGDSLTDVSPLSSLSNLANLSLGGTSLTDVSSLSGLRNLTSLNLGSDSLSDIRPLSGLARPTSYSGGCKSLTDVSPLSGLANLTSLNLGGCSKLCDINPLAGLANLTSLYLHGCQSLADLHSLSGMVNLKGLHLEFCFKLTDLHPLAELVHLNGLHLGGCESLTDVSPLSGLVNLTGLNLRGCKLIKNVLSLSNLLRLQELNISDLPRLRSLEPLRAMTSLRRLETDFHPGIAAEVLAHAAAFRSDLEAITKNAVTWLGEAEQFDDQSAAERERLATTLGEAFSLLGEHGISPRYEAFLTEHPEFSAAPWKAWFLGTRQASGFGLLQQRINSISVEKMTTGAIGGTCAALSNDAAAAAEQDWSRVWLHSVEKHHADRATTLKPIAPELCLALARLGERESLDRWLERFTDPSDPGALDPLQAALAHWQIERGQTNEALAHAAAIQSTRERDPLLAALVAAWVQCQPDRAGETLLMIETPTVRREASLKLAAEPLFTQSAGNVHRLVVAAGDSPKALGELIRSIGSIGNADLLLEIAGLLKADEEQLLEWRITKLEALLRQLREN